MYHKFCFCQLFLPNFCLIFSKLYVMLMLT
nr:MAG TPA: hypothetical protein [Caudoviricetes sp.]